MTKVGELRDELYTNAALDIDRIKEEWGYHDDDDEKYAERTRQVALNLANLILAARAEGVAEEREKIRGLAMPVEGNFLHMPSLIIPISVFNEPDPIFNPEGKLPESYGDSLPIKETPCSG